MLSPILASPSSLSQCYRQAFLLNAAQARFNFVTIDTTARKKKVKKNAKNPPSVFGDAAAVGVQPEIED
jgi:hypothetical protein